MKLTSECHYLANFSRGIRSSRFMKKVVNTLKLLIFFVVIFLSSQLLVSMFSARLHLSGDVGFMLSYALSMGLIYLLTTLYERAEFGMVRPIMKSTKGFDPVAVLMGVVLLVAISVTLWPLKSYLPADDRVFNDGVYTLLTVVFISPIMEECIFRGRLYSLLGHSASPFVAAFLSSLTFALIHLQPIVIIDGFLSGMLFSYMYLLKRSIILPILLHISNNIIAYTLQMLTYAGRPLMEYIDDRGFYLPLYAISAVLVLMFVGFMVHRFYKEKKLIKKNLVS